MYEHLDESIAVIALFEQGRLRPIRFRWKDRVYRIARITGQWIAYQGQRKLHHYAALCEGSSVFELCYDPANTAWRLQGVHLDA